MKQIEVKVSYYIGFGHSGGRYSSRIRLKTVSDEVGEQLAQMMKARKAAKKEAAVPSADIRQAISDGAEMFISMHNDLLRSDTATGYYITKVTAAPKEKKTQK